MTGKIYFVRHGTIPSNKRRVYAGWSEEELDPDGVGPVKEAGVFLSGRSVRRIFSSPLKRAMQTSAILQEFLPEAEISVEAGLKEMKLGPWEGMFEDDIAVQYPAEYEVWKTTPSELRLSGRETLQQLQLRALSAVRRLESVTREGSSVVAVTHVALIRVLWLYSNDMALDSYKTVDVPNASIFQFSDDNHLPSMERML